MNVFAAITIKLTMTASTRWPANMLANNRTANTA